MNDLCRVARVWGLSFLVGFCGLAFGLRAPAGAHRGPDRLYPNTRSL